VTDRRDSESVRSKKPKKDERPKIKKEKLRDLEARDGESVKAGLMHAVTEGECSNGCSGGCF
jgi:hypothetical protein